MAKMTGLLTLVALTASCSPAAAAEPVKSATIQGLQNYSNKEDSYLNKIFDVGNYIFDSLKAVKIFIESTNTAKPEIPAYSPEESLIVPLAPQIAKKPQGAQMLEMGMNVPVGQKFSLGAEIGVSKHKNNATPEAQQKRPSASLRLKPDLYTFKVGLKYKI